MSRPLRIAHVTTIDLTLRKLLLAQLCRLRDEGFDVYGISAPGPSAAELESCGIRHIPWEHATRSWRPGADARAFVELLGIFRKWRFDLVHVHNPKPAILGRIAGRLAGVPCVVSTSHGLYATPEDRLAKRLPILALEWLAARCSDLDLYQSEEDLAWVRRARVARPHKTELLGNGTDLSRFDPGRVSQRRVAALRAELGIPEGNLVVGTIGRLVAEKGYREFFEAARRVTRDHREVSFVVVGDSDDDKADALTTEEIDRAQEHVIFAGWREDIPDLLGIMDIFVLASWREGMPRSAIEAAAMGKPLVLTDIRGCREVARHRAQGLLVPVRSAADLASAVTELLDDPAMRASLGSAARRRAQSLFDEQRVAEVVAARSRELLIRKGLRSEPLADAFGVNPAEMKP